MNIEVGRKIEATEYVIWDIAELPENWDNMTAKEQIEYVAENGEINFSVPARLNIDDVIDFIHAKVVINPR